MGQSNWIVLKHFIQDPNETLGDNEFVFLPIAKEIFKNVFTSKSGVAASTDLVVCVGIAAIEKR